METWQRTSVANELASNAICHTRSGLGGEFTVGISRQGRLVRIMVTDGGAPGGPRLVDNPDGEGGRGLVVVNALTLRAGVDGDHHGRAVWAATYPPDTGGPRTRGGR
jgi:serine/threonine-protein kinase RsbW